MPLHADTGVQGGDWYEPEATPVLDASHLPFDAYRILCISQPGLSNHTFLVVGFLFDSFVVPFALIILVILRNFVLLSSIKITCVSTSRTLAVSSSIGDGCRHITVVFVVLAAFLTSFRYLVFRGTFLGNTK